jgi:hypothetical protein
MCRSPGSSSPICSGSVAVPKRIRRFRSRHLILPPPALVIAIADRSSAAGTRRRVEAKATVGVEKYEEWRLCGSRKGKEKAGKGFHSDPVAAPKLTRNCGIQLNARVSLRCHRECVVIYHRTISPRPGPQWQIRQVTIFRSAALLTMTLGFEMPPRLQKYLWRVVDNAMPDGPPFFLTFLVLFLLIVNGLILLLRG